MTLEIGLNRALHIREERLSARHDPCRLLYISDIHLRNGRSGRLSRQVLDTVAGVAPMQYCSAATSSTGGRS